MSANDLPAAIDLHARSLAVATTCDVRRRTVLHGVVAMLALALVPRFARAASASLPTRFDPKRDPAADLAAAMQMAATTNRRVILDVGGEWCSWCHILDAFFQAHPDLLALRERHYVWLKVNYSPDNRNRAFLDAWPKIEGYPHLFVVDAQGKLVHSQDTGALERGKSYSEEAIRAFLVRYAPPSGAAQRA